MQPLMVGMFVLCVFRKQKVFQEGVIVPPGKHLAVKLFNGAYEIIEKP